MKLLLAFLIAVGVMLLLGAAYFTFVAGDGKRSLVRRLRFYSTVDDFGDEAPKDWVARYTLLFKQGVQFMAALLRPLPQSVSLERKLQRSGIPMFASEFLLMLGGVGLAVFVVAWLLFGSVAQAFALALLAAASGFIYLDYRISRRVKAFHRQLGDALLMMANALRSGFSFVQAVELVSQDMKPPVSEEFGRMVQELRLGVTTEEALEHLSKRVRSDDLDLIIAAVLIQRQVGGNLAYIFDTISATIQDRLRMRVEVSTLTAQGQISGWVLGLMPIVMGGFMALINPEYIKPLFETSMGQVAIVVGLLSECIGILWIRRIVDIKL